jgi:NAD(P)-dependent dehydrogenase (short-subunit alcohol dehydrogenase family)
VPAARAGRNHGWCTARSIEQAQTAADGLNKDGDVLAAQLDVANDVSVDVLATRLPRVDILVNNAAIDYDTDSRQ